MCHFHTIFTLNLSLHTHFLSLIYQEGGKRGVNGEMPERGLFQVTQLVWTVAGFLPGVSESKICALNPCRLLPVTGRGLSPILGCCLKKKNQISKPSAPWSLLPVSLALAFPLSFLSGLLCLSQPVARGSAFTKWGAPLALARILLQYGHSLLSLPTVPQVTPVLLDPAGPCAWQLAGPLSCRPVAALQTVPIACWFALIIFRPGSDACWRQSMWATKHPRTVRPSSVWTLLVNYLWTEETLEGKIPFRRRNQIYKNQAHSGCLLSDLCLCGLDIWGVWASADPGGHLFP